MKKGLPLIPAAMPPIFSTKGPRARIKMSLLGSLGLGIMLITSAGKETRSRPFTTVNTSPCIPGRRSLKGKTSMFGVKESAQAISAKKDSIKAMTNTAAIVKKFFILIEMPLNEIN